MNAKILGMTPGQWVSTVLVVGASLVLLQLFLDGFRKAGGRTGARVAQVVENATGLR